MTEIKHRLPENPTYISPEECTQMTGMFKWAGSNEEFQFLGLRMFKQYSQDDKITRLIYEISGLLWRDGKWVSVIGKGNSLTEAMQAFTKTWESKK